MWTPKAGDLVRYIGDCLPAWEGVVAPEYMYEWDGPPAPAGAVFVHADGLVFWAMPNQLEKVRNNGR